MRGFGNCKAPTSRFAPGSGAYRASALALALLAATIGVATVNGHALLDNSTTIGGLVAGTQEASFAFANQSLATLAAQLEEATTALASLVANVGGVAEAGIILAASIALDLLARLNAIVNMELEAILSGLPLVPFLADNIVTLKERIEAILIDTVVAAALVLILVAIRGLQVGLNVTAAVSQASKATANATAATAAALGALSAAVVNATQSLAANLSAPAATVAAGAGGIANATLGLGNVAANNLTANVTSATRAALDAAAAAASGLVAIAEGRVGSVVGIVEVFLSLAAALSQVSPLSGGGAGEGAFAAAGGLGPWRSPRTMSTPTCQSLSDLGPLQLVLNILANLVTVNATVCTTLELTLVLVAMATVILGLVVTFVLEEQAAVSAFLKTIIRA